MQLDGGTIKMAHPASSTHLFLIRSDYHILLFVCLFVFSPPGHNNWYIFLAASGSLLVTIQQSLRIAAIAPMHCNATQSSSRNSSKKQKENTQTECKYFYSNPKLIFWDILVALVLSALSGVLLSPHVAACSNFTPTYSHFTPLIFNCSVSPLPDSNWNLNCK